MEEDKEKKPPLNNYLKYSGVGFQIAGALALGVFIGYKLDEKLRTAGPYFTVGFALVFLIAGMYLGLKDLVNKQ
ncbi:MAG: AtpZ/AtpI family protein [Bacteroidetes bacterium]|nr:AtpZ/AtpI family protein [Bacteroidota bacterium]